ncbi:MAG: exopolysaccharide biosynthesis protein [Acidobacteriaceae bacterium]|nr:exopolysaccharide biosynthesis protein [Acidobacteriaceae bacterium]
MIDIHHHLLPGLDDGSDSMETSVEMARLAVAEGITHIVCTPHANNYYTFDPEANAAKADELRERLAAESLPLTLGLGCDFHLSFDNIQLALTDSKRFSINGLGYLLVELPDFGLPPGLTETYFQLRLAGMTPVLTHPERNPTLQKDSSRMIDWLRGGMLVQVTADALTGHKGKRAQQMAFELLDKRWVHFLASDAHNLGSRPPRMREAHDLVAKKYGADYARSLCVTNPLAVFQGKSFTVEDQPRGLVEEQKDPTLWQRFTARLHHR